MYGDSYANPLFYKESDLAEAIATQRLCSVGALSGDGRVLGHMAMSLSGAGDTPELGNTVVDPDARGSGVAWQVGAELTTWCREMGFTGFLHYPTADHHIMQRQSVKRGFETGLMLGYIPADTDGKVRDARQARRQAATIVYEPLAAGEQKNSFLPAYGAELVRSFAQSCQLPRIWLAPDTGRLPARSVAEVETQPERGLVRSTVRGVGQDIESAIAALQALAAPCAQIDFLMIDPGIEFGVEVARRRGFVLSGWLPGFRDGDVLRVQQPQVETTNMAPDLVNSTAREILAWIGT